MDEKPASACSRTRNETRENPHNLSQVMSRLRRLSFQKRRERSAAKARDGLQHTSYLGEETVLEKFLRRLRSFDRFVVDIGASDGVTMSNTFALFKDGWRGLAIEFDGASFARLAATYAAFNAALVRTKVTPRNVVDLLTAHEVPRDLTFLSMDIDGYDHFVLAALLEHYRPKLICTEINEKIPPPLKFTVKWDPEYVWAEDHFFGQSLAKLGELLVETRYDLVELHYNNAFIAPRELGIATSLTVQEAYESGYVRRPDRSEKFPWNRDVDHVLTMDPVDAEDFFRAFFAKYEGQFELYC